MYEGIDEFIKGIREEDLHDKPNETCTITRPLVSGEGTWAGGEEVPF